MLNRLIQLVKKPLGYDCRRCEINRVDHPLLRCSFCENVATQILFDGYAAVERLDAAGKLWPSR